MKQLVIVENMPYRKGPYLVIEEGSSITPIAKFRNEAAVELFRLWATESAGITYQDERER